MIAVICWGWSHCQFSTNVLVFKTGNWLAAGCRLKNMCSPFTWFMLICFGQVICLVFFYWECSSRSSVSWPVWLCQQHTCMANGLGRSKWKIDITPPNQFSMGLHIYLPYLCVSSSLQILPISIVLPGEPKKCWASGNWWHVNKGNSRAFLLITVFHTSMSHRCLRLPFLDYEDCQGSQLKLMRSWRRMVVSFTNQNLESMTCLSLMRFSFLLIKHRNLFLDEGSDQFSSLQHWVSMVEMTDKKFEIISQGPTNRSPDTWVGSRIPTSQKTVHGVWGKHCIFRQSIHEEHCQPLKFIGIIIPAISCHGSFTSPLNIHPSHRFLKRLLLLRPEAVGNSPLNIHMQDVWAPS